MEPKLLRLLFIAFLFINTVASAQGFYSISGAVTDSLGRPQKSATVFLSGTKRITSSNDKGEFAFDGMSAGTYQLSVSMIGFAPYAQNIIVQGDSKKVGVILKSKTENLREVVIGVNNRQTYLTIFKETFIGSTINALACTLTNPEALNFYFDKKTGVLTADADELLVLENQRLGYRIKYLLKNFSYNIILQSTSYDGETNFEELAGTETQKAEWIKNRAATYQISMMHFLRSVYHHETQKEGFVVYNLYNLSPVVSLRGRVPNDIDANPIDVDELIAKADSPFVSLNFRVLFVEYLGTKMAGKLTAKSPDKKIQKLELGYRPYGNILKLVEPEVRIDARGSYAEHSPFYIKGYFSVKRVGDQLPFEYQPPESKTP